MKELLRRKSVRAGLLVIVLIVAVGIVDFNVRSAQRRKEYNGHVEAAEKYLTELDYEQAIAEYTLALEIEPKSEEMLNALEQIYLDYAQSLVDIGDYEKAVNVLEEGYERTDREELYKEIQEILVSVIRINVGIQDAGSRFFAFMNGANYIPDEQIKAECRKYVFLWERFQIYCPDEEDRIAVDICIVYDCIQRAYYILGEYELCLEMRKQLYEKTGDYRFAPEETTHYEQNDNCRRVYDKYGREISYYMDPNSIEEDVRTSFSHIKEYGEDGKIMQEKGEYWFDGKHGGKYIKTYEYDESGRVLKVTGDQDMSPGLRRIDFAHLTDIETYLYNEKGVTIHFYYRYEYYNGETKVSEHDQDYYIDETGWLVEASEIYNAINY
jgi:tetratricopeptide (TPR) repeat protein